MILEFSIENFKSIKEKINFSLEAVGGHSLSKNLIDLNSSRLVKSSIIYGPNASGKSNIIEGLFFMWRMVVNSHSFNVQTKIPRIPFKFDEVTLKEPSKFEIIFIHNRTKYRYGFSCTEDKIVEEYLYYWEKNKRLIFNRKDEKFTPNMEKGQQDFLFKKTIPNVLYLSRATQLGYERTRPVYEFFLNSLVINTNPLWSEYTIKAMSENKELKEKIIEILKRSDFGGIDEILIKKEKRPVKEFSFDSTTGMSEKEVEKEVYDVEFMHMINNRAVKLGIYEESLGTQSLFAMLGPIFDILQNGKVAVIDEIERSLHPNIVKFIVKLFSSRHNVNNAQLIFSTHATCLLDNNIFRKDQVYFCEKEPNKSTKLHSLLEFDIRQDANFEKAYLEGRFGAIPFIDETYTE